MEVARPTEITPEALRAKGEHFEKTGELTSDILANLGEAPNIPELRALGDYVEFEFMQDANTGLIAISRLFTDQDVKEILRAFQPLIEKTTGHYRTMLNIPLQEGIKGYGRLDGGKVVTSSIHDSTANPHTDGSPSNPEKGIFYLTTLVGWPTAVWKGTFKEAEDFTIDVNKSGASVIELHTGETVCLDSQTVHASPVDEMAMIPELVGTDRAIVSLGEFKRQPAA